MAPQQKLGILPQRASGADTVDRDNTGADAKDIR
jgi:hypothetical protein